MYAGKNVVKAQPMCALNLHYRHFIIYADVIPIRVLRCSLYPFMYLFTCLHAANISTRFYKNYCA